MLHQYANQAFRLSGLLLQDKQPSRTTVNTPTGPLYVCYNCERKYDSSHAEVV